LYKDDNNIAIRVVGFTAASSVRRLHRVHQVLGVVLVGAVLLGRGGRLLHVRGVVARHVGRERCERCRLANRTDGARGHEVTGTEAAEAPEVGVPAEPQHGQYSGQSHDAEHQHLLDDHDGHQYGHQQRLDHQELERRQQWEQQRVLLVWVVFASTCNQVNHYKKKKKYKKLNKVTPPWRSL